MIEQIWTMLTINESRWKVYKNFLYYSYNFLKLYQNKNFLKIRIYSINKKDDDTKHRKWPWIAQQRPCRPGENGMIHSKCWKKETLPRILHPGKLSVRNEDKIKTFPNKQT